MRAILCVLDSFGVGSADSAAPGDRGANTFGHVAIAAAEGRADREGLRSGPLKTPNLLNLGLGRAAEQAGEIKLPIEHPAEVSGRYGFAAERSFGKDTPSGHWEMSGLPVEFDWGYFPLENSFPKELLDAFVEKAGLPGVLGNKHASGTEIIKELGEEHIRTGKPIVYTSADSVFQIAAHETHFGLERLYEICKIARGLVDPYNVGRVIARPFVGETPDTFKRTGNRKDLAVPPHGVTLLDRVKDAGREVIAIGKVGDIFAYKGVTQTRKASDNPSVYKVLSETLDDAPDGSLVFVNFNDLDTLYGHRRDVAGYAACLEAFDGWLPSIQAKLKPGDVMVITADHGCDPTWEGSDHTREYTPVLAFGPGVTPENLGRRETFADIGQSLAKHLQVDPLPFGASFL
ncbi:MAG: phosphopentomutase [Proteobacteria bacterium]|nr:phosphopentomutase [Pseudomonadota bacterium]